MTTVLTQGVDGRARSVATVLTAIDRRKIIWDDLIKQRIRLFDDCEADFDAAQAPQALFGETWPPYLRTDAEKRVAGSFGNALKKLEKWFARLESQSDAPLQLAVLSRAVSGNAVEFFEWKNELTRWRQHFESCASQLKEKSGLFFGQRGDSKLKKFVLQRAAAEQSAAILVAHGIPLSATPKRGEGKAGSVLIQVAKKIIGKRDLKVEYECRNLAAREKTIKVAHGRKSRNRASK
jgi:hypothetical protein